MSKARLHLVAVLPWLTGIGVFIELLSLRLGPINRFVFDDVQGIDYFFLPSVLTLIRIDRVLPVTVLFVLLTVAVIRPSRPQPHIV